MNKQELAIAKRIAEIDGLQWRTDTDEGIVSVSTLKRWTEGSKKCYTWSEYNPFDWSILGPLMLKYEVEPCYRYNEVAVWTESTWIKVKFNSKEEIPRAILECIIKSKEGK